MRLTAAFTSLVALAIGASGASIRDTTASATAMMVVPLDVGNVSLAEFNPFYDTDHIPRVMALPGFLSASRFDSIDGLFPAQTTMYDLATIEAIHSPEWQFADTHRPANELDIISRIAFVDLLNYVLDGTPVGSVHGPSVLGFYEFTPTEGQEDYVHNAYDTKLVPILQRIPGFQRARRYKLESYVYFKDVTRPAPPTFMVSVEFEDSPGAEEKIKSIQSQILPRLPLKEVTARLYRTHGTFGPWA